MARRGQRSPAIGQDVVHDVSPFDRPAPLMLKRGFAVRKAIR